jgi:hypothetical protein
MIDHDAIERHFEFFGDQHRDRRVHAMSHFDLWNHHRDLVAPVDLDESVRREHAILRRFVYVATDHRFVRRLTRSAPAV